MLQFHNLFPQNQLNADYSFLYRAKEIAYINKGNYEEEIEKIQEMEDEVIIFIEIMNNININSIDFNEYNNDELAKSIYNEENMEVNNSLRESQNENLGQKEKINKIEEELKIANEKYEREYCEINKIEKMIDDLIKFNNNRNKNKQNDYIDKIYKLKKEKKEILDNNELITKENNQIKEELEQKKEEISELKKMINTNMNNEEQNAQFKQDIEQLKQELIIKKILLK